jgi:type III pantothenate kinase
MKLLIDIGNSRLKWTCIDAGNLTETQSFIRGKTGIKAALTKHWKKLADIESIFVSNVAGDKIAQQLEEWTLKKWDVKPKFISSEQKRFGVTNAYQQPEQLGVDRWLALIAARQHARLATCVIDCGTAITLDIVTKYGEHQGGMILPGLSLMREALTSNTVAIKDTLDDSEFKTLATNTYSAVQSGTLYSVTATLERIISDLKQQFNNSIRFIITGGDAETILPLLSQSIAHYPDIVLKGLAYYARQGERKAHPIKTETVESVESVESTILPEEAI